MAFFRKAGNILGRTVNNHFSADTSSSKPFIFQAIRCMSSSKLFVGGLSYSTDDTSLGEAFSKYGEVYEAKVIVDRDTGRSRGFGFVNYSSVEDASAAIQALDQQELHGRRVRVNYANERTSGYGGGNYGTVGNPNFAGDNYGSGVETAAYPTNGRESHTGGFDGRNLSYGSDEQSIGAANGGSGNNFFGHGSSSSASSGYDGSGDNFDI